MRLSLASILADMADNGVKTAAMTQNDTVHVKQAQLLHASMRAGFLSRLAGYDAAAAKTASPVHYSAKTAENTGRARQIAMATLGGTALGASGGALVGGEGHRLEGALAGGALGTGMGFGAGVYVPPALKAVHEVGEGIRHVRELQQAANQAVSNGVLDKAIREARSGVKSAAMTGVETLGALGGYGLVGGALGAPVGAAAGGITNYMSDDDPSVTGVLRGAGKGALVGGGLGAAAILPGALIGGHVGKEMIANASGRIAHDMDALPGMVVGALGATGAAGLAGGVLGGRDSVQNRDADYAQGQEDALQEIHKIASDVHFAGQQSAANVLATLAGSY
jgi:hypothetical protein